MTAIQSYPPGDTSNPDGNDNQNMQASAADILQLFNNQDRLTPQSAFAAIVSGGSGGFSGPSRAGSSLLALPDSRTITTSAPNASDLKQQVRTVSLLFYSSDTTLSPLVQLCADVACTGHFAPLTLNQKKKKSEHHLTLTQFCIIHVCSGLRSWVRRVLVVQCASYPYLKSLPPTPAKCTVKSTTQTPTTSPFLGMEPATRTKTSISISTTMPSLGVLIAMVIRTLVMRMVTVTGAVQVALGRGSAGPWLSMVTLMTLV